MAFDFEIHGGEPNSVSVQYDLFNEMHSLVKNEPRFSVLRKCFSDFFGEYELTLQEVSRFYEELQQLRDFSDKLDRQLSALINDLNALIKRALLSEQMIRLTGD
ncbi:MAG: hypothetical protein ABWZ25_17550 [Chitinophagaceae bacterium]